jgi:hypothetical protein
MTINFFSKLGLLKSYKSTHFFGKSDIPLESNVSNYITQDSIKYKSFYSNLFVFIKMILNCDSDQ